MGLMCIFGHKWNGCKCDRCGKIRDEQHDWDLCKGKCKRCGKTQAVQHEWNGCKCKKCGKERHDWKDFKCIICGMNKSGVRNEEVQKINDQTILADIAKNTGNKRQVRLFAVKKITDQTILAEIAKNVKLSNVYEAAFKRLNQNVLSDIAKHNEDGYKRMAAADYLTDKSLAQEVYFDIAKKHNQGVGGNLGWWAVDKISNKAMLEKVAKNACDWNVRERAKSNLEVMKRANESVIIKAPQNVDIIENCIHVMEFTRETDMSNHYTCIHCGKVELEPRYSNEEWFGDLPQLW